FYAQGVKTNVLFFSKPKQTRQDTGNTKNVWVYDLRANMPQFGKRTVLTAQHFAEFIECFGDNPLQADDKARAAFVARHSGEADSCRLRCFTREQIAEKDDTLDLSWIRDEDAEDASNLPEPDVLINEAIEEMAGAMKELQGILLELGAEEQREIG
ncbi:MAG: SAM-dependent methyltransferase, partial [Methylococcaceae bacterium]|nr:SAM-dependent methyltransferase [Methylococcaceae bacterium]